MPVLVKVIKHILPSKRKSELFENKYVHSDLSYLSIDGVLQPEEGQPCVFLRQLRGLLPGAAAHHRHHALLQTCSGNTHTSIRLGYTLQLWEIGLRI